MIAKNRPVSSFKQGGYILLDLSGKLLIIFLIVFVDILPAFRFDCHERYVVYCYKYLDAWSSNLFFRVGIFFYQNYMSVTGEHDVDWA